MQKPARRAVRRSRGACPRRSSSRIAAAATCPLTAGTAWAVTSAGPQLVAVRRPPGAPLGQDDRRQLGQQPVHRHQSARDAPVPSALDRLERRPPSSSANVAGPRPPQRLEVRAAPERAARGRAPATARRSPPSSTHAQLARGRRRTTAAPDRVTVTLDGLELAPACRCRASLYAGAPPIFFAENGGGVCWNVPRNAPSASRRSRVSAATALPLGRIRAAARRGRPRRTSRSRAPNRIARVVFLVGAAQERREPRRAADDERQHAGRERIERAGVADARVRQRAPHDARRRRARSARPACRRRGRRSWMRVLSLS